MLLDAAPKGGLSLSLGTSNEKKKSVQEDLKLLVKLGVCTIRGF